MNISMIQCRLKTGEKLQEDTLGIRNLADPAQVVNAQGNLFLFDVV